MASQISFLSASVATSPFEGQLAVLLLNRAVKLSFRPAFRGVHVEYLSVPQLTSELPWGSAPSS